MAVTDPAAVAETLNVIALANDTAPFTAGATILPTLRRSVTAETDVTATRQARIICGKTDVALEAAADTVFPTDLMAETAPDPVTDLAKATAFLTEAAPFPLVETNLETARLIVTAPVDAALTVCVKIETPPLGTEPIAKLPIAPKPGIS